MFITAVCLITNKRKRYFKMLYYAVSIRTLKNLGWFVFGHYYCPKLKSSEFFCKKCTWTSLKTTKNISITVSYFLSGCCHQCYRCLSVSGWDDCDSKKEKVPCDRHQATCVKFELELKDWGGTMYAKACGPSDAWCTHVKTDPDGCPKGDTCKAYCCDKDLCNGATVPMTSVAILVACVLVALHRLAGL